MVQRGSRAMSITLLTVLLLLCAAVAVAAGAEQGPSLETPAALKRADEFFRSNSITLWPQVWRIAGVETEMRAPPARYAALIPTDAAVESFLKQMGLTMQTLAVRPQLAKQLVTQHLVLALPPDAQAALLDGKYTSIPTAATTFGGGNSTVLKVAVMSPRLVAKGGNQQQQQQQQGRRLMITDGQGNVVSAVKVVRQDANKVAIIIDKVLMSGHYYTNFASLCKHRAAQAGPMCGALTQTGILQNPNSPNWPNTVFMPGPRAFQQAGIQISSSSSSSKQQLLELVQYHVVPGARAFPDGFTAGGAYETLLPGASLGIEYSGVAQALRNVNSTLETFVIPADKQRVPVVLYNMFVGQGVVQGIPAVLLPPGFKVTRPKTPQAVAATAAEKGQTAAQTSSSSSSSSSGGSASGSSGRRLLGGGIDTPTKTVMPFNAAETEIRSKARSMFKDAEDKWK